MSHLLHVLTLEVCQVWQRRREKYKNKGDKKRGKGNLLLLPESEACLYFLKIKTTSFHKVIYFKKNKLYKIQLRIFFPMFVENIELGNKITYIQVTTISYPPKKRRVKRNTTTDFLEDIPLTTYYQFNFC